MRLLSHTCHGKAAVIWSESMKACLETFPKSLVYPVNKLT